MSKSYSGRKYIEPVLGSSPESHINRIYCGKRVFKRILNEVKSPCIGGEFVYGGISFVLNTLIAPTAMLTLDPKLGKAIKTIEAGIK